MGAVAQSPDALACHAAIFGAPHGTPYPGIDGTRHAGTAAALRRAIAEDAQWRDHWDFDVDGPVIPDPAFVLADCGDLATAPDDAAANRAAIEGCTRRILAAGAVPVMVGGDDSVPIPFLAGFAPRPVAILQIDAHIDWRDERFGERLGFSSTMRRASEMAHVTAMTQVGMRGLGSARASEVAAARAWGAELVTAVRLHEAGVAAAIAHLPAGADIVVCLDMDALDAAVMPAVAYPSPGGLSHGDVLALVAGVAARGRLAGFSLVEFVPGRDVSGASAFLAGRILWNVVGRIARAGGRGPD